MLKINKEFAKKYDEYRQKEELQKLKAKYGDAKLSDVKRQTNGSADNNADAGSDPDASSSSSSSDSDDSSAGWTPGMEAGFLRVYAALESGDSRLYDPGVSWFQEAEQQEDDEDKEAEEDDDAAGDKHRPMYYNEYHRKYLLEGAYTKADDHQEAANQEEQQADPATQRDLQEAEKIRKSLAESHAKDSDSDEDDSSDEAAFLSKKRQQRPQFNGGGEDADPMQRLHQFVSDEADPGEDLDAECRADLSKLKRRWADDSGLSEAERYLRDYITKEYWRRRPRQLQQGRHQRDDADDEEADSGDDDDADEAFLARQSEFEAKWNGRVEERDPEFESGYRRTFASGERFDPGEEDDDDDEELFVVADNKKEEQQQQQQQPAVEDAEVAAVTVVEELRRLERRRGWRDNGDEDDGGEDQAEGDDDNDVDDGGGSVQPGSVRTYPRRIADSLRESAAAAAGAATARAKSRAQRRERRRSEKLTKRRELEQLARLKEAEIERRLGRLRRNAGVAGGGGDGCDDKDRVADVLGGDFLEADFDPAEHDKRMASLFGDEFYDGKAADVVEDEGRPQFSDDEDLQAAGPADEAPAESAEELRRRLQDEADQMCAEDFIRSGPGQEDVRCRFNFHQAEPNDFGLSAAEIIMADDRELNAWCSVRKASQYRERDADWRDRRRFRAARTQARKATVMAGMMRRLEDAAAFPDADAWLAWLASGKGEGGEQRGDAAAAAGEAGAPDVKEASGTGKKRRRQKKRKNRSGEDIKDAAADATAAEATPRSRSRKRRKTSTTTTTLSPPEAAPTAETAVPTAKTTKTATKTPKAAKKNKDSADRLRISEQRLLELGIDPKKFHRMRRAKATTAAASTSG